MKPKQKRIRLAKFTDFVPMQKEFHRMVNLLQNAEIEFHIKIRKDLRLVNYEPRLKVCRNLEAMKSSFGSIFSSEEMARRAATEISKSPIVTEVTLHRVIKKKLDTYCNGKAIK